MKQKHPLTVIVSVKNEELNLYKCLENLFAFDQVIVLDSGSTDETVPIAMKMGAEVVQFSWNGKFPKKRNWALQNIDIKHDWVLFLDADEFVGTDFIEEVAVKIKNQNYNGYDLHFENYFMGKKLRFGYGLKKTALFRKSKGAYEKIEEYSWSQLDMEVHEHPIIKGNIGTIKTKVMHKDFNNLEHYIDKHNSYSSWEANRFIQLKKTKKAYLSINQRIKYYLLSTGVMPLAYFFGTYFFKGGFLDGKAGFFFAVYKTYYFFQIQTKIRELIN